MANKRTVPYGSAGGPPTPPEPPIQYDKKSKAFGETPAGDTFVQRFGRNALRQVVQRARARRRP
jgi:hypothetical protein